MLRFCLHLGLTNLLVPLFWSQPGLALKPPLKLDRPIKDAIDPARVHFQSCAQICTSDGKPSPVVCVNLVEKDGREGVVGGGYGQLVKELKGDDVKLTRFAVSSHTIGTLLTR